MTDVRAYPLETTDAATAKPRFFRRRWVQLAAVGVICLGIGGASGSNSASKATKNRDVALTKVAQMTTERDAATAAADTAKKAQADAEAQAASAKALAMKDVEVQLTTRKASLDGQFASRKAALDAQEGQIAKSQAALAAREAKVTGQEHAYAVGTIPGDGMFLVGSDIAPGVYKATAADSGSCYFARLHSGTTSDIIDNGNVSGPVVVTVQPGDYALELNGCNEFHKVG